MNDLLTKAPDANKEEIEKQIKLASYGEMGEKNIAFELKNSGMDMFILHDIYLEHGDMSAQIDYLVVTRKKAYIIECKNLIGNIEIDSAGNFVRTYEFKGRNIKEGIYSPITQNERHMRVLKEIRAESKGNFITKQIFMSNFDDAYKSLVVLANPKTYLNDRFAKKEVKQQVLRADQLINQIKTLDAADKAFDYSENEMRDLAEFFLNASKPNKSDYAKKYEEMVALSTSAAATNEEKAVSVRSEEAAVSSTSATDKVCPKCGSKMVLRTAKNGANAGNQFYGCSNFPKCRYVENV